ncbi:prolyl hydroxylase family protein [Alteromonas sp. 009811495]|uniref:prolyl hydroxylase family protein n=1 Tax=Alteromonas sp. 009811495 TaxID=3002962 RepID=UPI00237DAD3D|nr:2OG-Fe(II) oxygenase [Alteromonas sp. 009811495]WDT86789.1 2OG-Fe(II) oxygenase [Alteromonas sp. 009811495]
MSAMSAQWKQWVLKCLLGGTPVQHIINTLSENGFSSDTIRKVLGSNLNSTHKFDVDTDFYQRLAASAVTRNVNARALVSPSELQLYSIENFLSANECDAIVNLSKDRLAPSKLAGASSADNIRTSSTCELAFIDNELVTEIDARIVSTLQLGVGEREVIQAQHYNEGEYYKPHYDFFPPGTSQYIEHCATRGQRSWTCMVYLNDDCSGGHTRFTKLNIAVQPRKGMALFWNNLLANGDPNTNSIHFAEPVLNGHKTVITKWFRTKN